jgi:hypothetical protein
MKLVIRTSSVGYKSNDRLDITVQSGSELGKHFAPSWDMVRGVKSGKMSWEEYQWIYLGNLRSTWNSNREVFREVFRMEQVTLVCYCRSDETCHRRLLKETLMKIGKKYGIEVIDGGEIAPHSNQSKPVVKASVKPPSIKNWFSNMIPLDEPIRLRGIEYPTVENFYQAMKADKSEVEVHKRVAGMNPFEAKQYGKIIKLRPDWEEVKLGVMEYALRIKFASGNTWYRKLMETSGEIVEWNTWHDKFWGRCTCNKCRGEGENHLGNLLMQLRNEGECDILSKVDWDAVDECHVRKPYHDETSLVRMKQDDRVYSQGSPTTRSYGNATECDTSTTTPSTSPSSTSHNWAEFDSLPNTEEAKLAWVHENFEDVNPYLEDEIRDDPGIVDSQTVQLYQESYYKMHSKK